MLKSESAFRGNSCKTQRVCFFVVFFVADLSNGAVKKEASTKEVARIWINDIKMRSFSPTMVSSTSS